jgi:AAA+ ATPase superfamily predicted ATPase
MKSIEFHNREKEIKAIRNILDTKPTLITFIYGPINSGKTELINQIVPALPEDYVVFYINLRGRFIKSYEEFLDVLFEIDEERKIENAKEYAKAIVKDLKNIGGIPIPINLFEKMFERKERSKDVFRYIERFMTEIAKKYMPVLIVDELQVIGDVQIDDLLVYKLFNFFIRLTKEMHLCHVFAMTSDSLFIERDNEAMLEGRCRYLLVDDFDYAVTTTFLAELEFTDDEKAIALEYCGGKPGYLVELANTKFGSGNIAEKAEEMLEAEISRLIFLLARNKEKKSAIRDMLAIFAPVEAVKYTDSMDLTLLSFLVKQNILFLDPVKRTIKPQSRLNLLAIRAVMKNGIVETSE